MRGKGDGVDVALGNTGFNRFSYDDSRLTIPLRGGLCHADPCRLLSTRWISLNANGFANGVLGSKATGIETTVEANGTYHFDTTLAFPNEPSDEVTGTCKARHLIMTRTRAGGFQQEYDGWIFKGDQDFPEMAGVFSHDGVLKYGWYGAMKPLSP